MGTQLLVRRQDNQIDVGPVDGSPLPFDLHRRLAAELSYNKKITLWGQDRWLDDGTKRALRIDTFRLYDISPVDGRMITSLGFLPRIKMVLKERGDEMVYQDISAPNPRADVLNPVWAEMTRFDEWRYRQWECVLQIVSAWGGGIVNACPGFGKTELITRICRLYPRAKIAVVTRDKDILESIHTRLLVETPKTGFVNGSKKNFQRVTCYSAGSVHHAPDDIDLVMGDEVHQLGADDLCRKFHMAFPHARRIGFTANPHDRLDGGSIRLEHMFGPEIFYLPTKEGIEHGLVVPLEVRMLPIRMTRNPMEGLVNDTTRVRMGVWRNETRNRIIAETARRHMDDQVLILTDRFEHLVFLNKLLPEYACVYGTPKEDVVAQLKSEHIIRPDFEPISINDRKNMRDAFRDGRLRKVIATDVWSTGVDFPDLGVLFRTDTRSSTIPSTQIPGRANRTSNGKVKGIIYDCYDCFDEGLLRKSQTRMRDYKANGWTVIKPSLEDD